MGVKINLEVINEYTSFLKLFFELQEIIHPYEADRRNDLQGW